GYTCVMYITDEVFNVPHAVFSVDYECRTCFQEDVHIHNIYNCGVPFQRQIHSVQQGMDRLYLSEAMRMCHNCRSRLLMKQTLRNAPQMLIIHLPDRTITRIDKSLQVRSHEGEIHTYDMEGIVYFAHEHFVCRIVSQGKL